jgi:hypothetical protein
LLYLFITPVTKKAIIDLFCALETFRTDSENSFMAFQAWIGVEYCDNYINVGRIIVAVVDDGCGVSHWCRHIVLLTKS